MKQLRDVSAVLQTSLSCTHTNTLIEQMDLLDRLPRVVGAKYDIARCCLADTRKEVIDTAVDWVSKVDDGTKVFWLHGLAGVGKSTIATSIARALSERRWLGGTFFFSRDVDSRSKPDQLFSTIAFQMSSVHPSITVAICRALTADLDIGRSAIVNQFEELVRGPLRATKGLGHPVVILLDALDECGSEKERKDLLDVIRRGLPDLPHFVKFVITSRPDADMRTLFTSMGGLVYPYDLNHQTALVDADILTFISMRMQDIALSHELTADWPGPKRRQALVRRAAGLFVWASTACNFIEDDQSDGPEMQLRLILEEPDIPSDIGSLWTALDALYLQVLRQSVPASASFSRLEELRVVLGTILLAVDPLSLLDLTNLLNVRPVALSSDGKAVRDILRKLHSVLVIPATDSQTLRIIHPSFVDFVTDPTRCTDDRFYLNPKAHHIYLTKRCLIRMQECLRRDICHVGTVPMMNEDISDLHQRLAHYVPKDLQYACRFWAEHLYRSAIDDELYFLVREFIFQNLLHWFEVMSLIGFHDASSAVLALAQASLKVIFSFFSRCSCI